MGGEPYTDIVDEAQVETYKADKPVSAPFLELPQQLLDYLAEHNIDLDDVPEPEPGPNMSLINYRAGLLTGIRW